MCRNYFCRAPAGTGVKAYFNGNETITITNPWGGLVYLIVPKVRSCLSALLCFKRGTDVCWCRQVVQEKVHRCCGPQPCHAPAQITQNTEAGGVDLSITGGVRAPLFWKGRTTQAEWLAGRNAEAPWAEILSDKFAITVPSRMVRNIQDANNITDYWDNVVDAYSDFIGVSRAPDVCTVACRIVACRTVWHHLSPLP